MIHNPFHRENSSKERESPTVLTGPRVPRHSSSWAALLDLLKAEPGKRVLDIGPTSPANINLLTGLGHGIYMADLVNESARDEWRLPPSEEGGEPGFDVPRFLDQNLDFAGREFDIVLLWTTLDYIPESLVGPVVKRLHSSMRPGGKVLALFHNRKAGQETVFCRYHLTDSADIEAQETNPYPIRRIYTNRSIEKIFESYAATRFYLAQDHLYEVLITR